MGLRSRGAGQDLVLHDLYLAREFPTRPTRVMEPSGQMSVAGHDASSDCSAVSVSVVVRIGPGGCDARYGSWVPFKGARNRRFRSARPM